MKNFKYIGGDALWAIGSKFHLLFIPLFMYYLVQNGSLYGLVTVYPNAKSVVGFLALLFAIVGMAFLLSLYHVMYKVQQKQAVQISDYVIQLRYSRVLEAVFLFLFLGFLTVTYNILGNVSSIIAAFVSLPRIALWSVLVGAWFFIVVRYVLVFPYMGIESLQLAQALRASKKAVMQSPVLTGYALLCLGVVKFAVYYSNQIDVLPLDKVVVPSLLYAIEQIVLAGILVAWYRHVKNETKKK